MDYNYLVEATFVANELVFWGDFLLLINFARLVCNVFTGDLASIKADYYPFFEVAFAISSLDRYRRRMPDFLPLAGWGIWFFIFSFIISPLPMHSMTENLNHIDSLSDLAVSFFYVPAIVPRSIINAQYYPPSSIRRGFVWIDRWPLRFGSILQDQSKWSLAVSLDRNDHYWFS